MCNELRTIRQIKANTHTHSLSSENSTQITITTQTHTHKQSLINQWNVVRMPTECCCDCKLFMVKRSSQRPLMAYAWFIQLSPALNAHIDYTLQWYWYNRRKDPWFIRIFLIIPNFDASLDIFDIFETHLFSYVAFSPKKKTHTHNHSIDTSNDLLFMSTFIITKRLSGKCVAKTIIRVHSINFSRTTCFNYCIRTYMTKRFHMNENWTIPRGPFSSSFLLFERTTEGENDEIFSTLWSLIWMSKIDKFLLKLNTDFGENAET